LREFRSVALLWCQGKGTSGASMWPQVGGLAVVSGEGYIRGINVAGLAVVGVEGVRGLSVAGLAVVAEENIKGFSLAGYKIEAQEAEWFTAAAWRVEVDDFRGISVSGWNDHKHSSRGLSIGIFNRTEKLHGVQIGLLNFAGNNGRFPWLPILNAHF